MAAGIETADLTVLRTVVMANAFLIISTVTFALFSYINLTVFNTRLIAVLDGVAALVSLIALIDLHRNQVLERAVIIGTVNFFLFFITFAYTNQNSDFGLIWTIFFPIFVITLMGHKKGLLVTFLFYILLFSMAYSGIGSWDNGTWNLRSFLRFSIASMVLTYVVYVYEAALHRSNTELARTRDKEAKYLEELQRLSATDSLTALHNRRKMDELLREHFNHAKRYQIPFSLMMFDIDDFKLINDRYGHSTGDEVLVIIADVLRKSLRSTDYCARWGGEEFMVLLPRTTLEQAVEIAEKLRQEIENRSYPHHLHVSCSFGVAQYDDESGEETLVEHADNALYAAKRSGKNCVRSDISPS